MIGGESGIGEAIVKELRARGDRVVTASRRSVDNTVDVRDAESVRRAIFLAKSSLGRIDVLLNMAAINQHKMTKLADSDPAEIKEIVDTNVMGVLNVAREASLLLDPGAQVVLCGGAGTNRYDFVLVCADL